MGWFDDLKENAEKGWENTTDYASTFLTNAADKITLVSTTAAAGILKTTELIPGVDYSDSNVVNFIYDNSERLTKPLQKYADPAVEWIVETGGPGAYEIGAYTATIVTALPGTLIMAGGQEAGLIDPNGEFAQNYNRRIDNIVGWGSYVKNEPLDALGQAGQGITNAVTTTAGLVVDVGRGAVNYFDDAAIGFINMGFKEDNRIKDDLWHPLGTGEESFFAAMTWSKDNSQWMPTIENDNPYAKYQRFTRYSTQAVGEVGAMVVTGGGFGAVWGATRGVKVVKAATNAGEEVVEAGAKVTAKATAAETTAKATVQETSEAAAKEATEAAARETAQEATKAGTAATEKTAETSVKAAETAQEATKAGTVATEKTAETSVKAAETATITTAEESAKASFNVSANAANETYTGAVQLSGTGSINTTATTSSRVTSATTGVSDDIGANVSRHSAGNTQTLDTAADAANDAIDDLVAIKPVNASNVGSVKVTGEAANEAIAETVETVVRGSEGAKEGWKKGIEFFDPRKGSIAPAIEVGAVTLTAYMETRDDEKQADQAEESGDKILQEQIKGLFDDYDLSAEYSTATNPTNALTAEFTNRANATQQPLNYEDGKPMFTITFENEESANKFLTSLKV